MIYDEDYLKEEIVCGYTISREKKKVRFVQLNILKEIIRICEKYGLTYFAAGGTLIGAVRHSGFIPWDDDIDVSMMRDDFNKFVDVAQKEVKYPYFFRTSITDKDYFANSIYICDSRTTCIVETPYIKKSVFNMGISIGISVMDCCEDNIEKLKKIRRKLHVSSFFANVYSGINKSAKVRPIYWLLHIFRYNTKKTWLKQFRFLTKYNEKWRQSDKVVTFMPIVQKIEKVIWFKEDFASVVKMKFETIKINVPVGYKRVLSGQFGDYMSFPPESERIEKHGAIFEPDLSYKDYCKKHYNTKYKENGDETN